MLACFLERYTYVDVTFRPDTHAQQTPALLREMLFCTGVRLTRVINDKNMDSCLICLQYRTSKHKVSLLFTIPVKLTAVQNMISLNNTAGFCCSCT